MTRRLPAPPPGAPGAGPPRPADDAPEPREPGELTEADLAETLDAELLDPEAFADDPEDPLLEAITAGEPHDLDALPSLEAPEEEDVEVPLHEEALDDDLGDLEAPDDADLPIVGWSASVRIEGRRLPARLDPARPRTLWLTLDAPTPEVEVTIELAGRAVRLAIERSAEDARPERVLVGRDVLADRFLLRP
ncbi:MAG: hypothetical protein R3F59_26635 [Myxococcota bacterium]